MWNEKKQMASQYNKNGPNKDQDLFIRLFKGKVLQCIYKANTFYRCDDICFNLNPLSSVIIDSVKTTCVDHYKMLGAPKIQDCS